MRGVGVFGFLRVVAIGVVLISLSGISIGQLEPASPPIADPSDKRFVGVHEDWTTAALTTSNLRPVRPLIGYSNDQGKYTVDFVRVQWRWGDPIDLYVMKPDGIKKPPVIIYLYGYPSTTDIFKDERYQAAVTKDGFAAVGFVSALTGHRYHDRPMREWFVSDLQECLATSAHDVREVLDYLASRGDLDMSRVGMFTQGSGSTIAILTSAVDPRIKTLDAVDPWGDWPMWMATSAFVPEEERANYVKPEFLKNVAMLDPVEWLPKIQAKKFRLQQTGYDRTTPDACKERLRAAAPPGTTVAIYKTEKEYDAALDGSKQLEWIEHEMDALPKPESATAAMQKPCTK
ncbi:MAG: alpha/beta hydrolase [Terriglobales bacterium]